MMTQKMLLLILSLLSLLSLPLHAAKPVSTWRLLQHKSFIQGGRANGFVTLADFRLTSSPEKKQERLVFDWGDKQLGYYHVSWDSQRPSVLHISFARALNTNFETKELTNKIKNSLFVKDIKMTFDRVDLSHHFVIELRQSVQVKVIDFYGEKARPARLVLDLVGKS